MKEEIENSVCVASIDIKIKAEDSNIKVVGIVDKVSAQDANSVLECFKESMFYDTRIRRCGNNTTIFVEDTLNETVHVDLLNKRIKNMHQVLKFIGETLVTIATMKEINVSLPNELENEESEPMTELVVTNTGADIKAFNKALGSNLKKPQEWPDGNVFGCLPLSAARKTMGMWKDICPNMFVYLREKYEESNS